MPYFELTAEGAKSLIEQLPDSELDKLCEMLMADEAEDEPNEAE